MAKKYILVTSDTKMIGPRTLYRILSLVDIPGTVAAGEMGGYIQSEANLDHSGQCWVADNACVFEDAVVTGNAKVRGNALVYGSATVRDNATVSGDSKVHGYASIEDHSGVFGNGIVCDEARLEGHANVHCRGRVCQNAVVYDYACVADEAIVGGEARIEDSSLIAGGAQVSGETVVVGRAVIKHEARINSSMDYMTMGPFCSHRNVLTAYRNEDGGIKIHCDLDLFSGSLEDLESFMKTSVSAKNGPSSDVIIQTIHAFLPSSDEAPTQTDAGVSNQTGRRNQQRSSN